MKKRILYFCTLYLSFMVVFACMKPLFMLCNGSITRGISFNDYLQVIYHGIGLDISVAGYLIIIPLLLVIVSCVFISFPARKILQYYFGIISLVIAIIFVLDTVLYSFWGFKLDASIFLYTDSPTNALASVSIGFILLRLLFILFLSAALFLLWRKITPNSFSVIKHKWAGILLFLCISGAVVVGIRGGTGESTANIGKAYFTNEQFLNHSAVNPIFSFLYSLGKSSDFKLDYRFFEEAEQTSLMENLYSTVSIHSDSLLNTSRPNVLLIILEGMGATLVEAVGGEANVTPQFNEWSKKGILFTNCYANSYRTDRGMVNILSGYPAFPVTSITKLPVKSQTMPSIAGALDSVGYTTTFIYGGDINFTNMHSYLLGTGFEKVISDNDFSYEQRHTHAWGVNDDIMFNFLLNNIEQAQSSEHPYFTAFLTLSSHEPWEVPYNRLPNKVSNAFAYTDDCIGSFLENLKQSSAWKDLLIILVPDHGIGYPEHIDKNTPMIHHIPMLWLGGAVKAPQKINQLCTQTDIAATLLGQMDIPHQQFDYSRDVVSESYNYPFAYYTFNNGFAFIDSTGTTSFDLNAGTSLDQTERSDIREKRGKAILQTSYEDLLNR